MVSLELTPIVPALAGTTFAATAVVSNGDEYDYIPMSSSRRVLVVITNADQSDPHTVTFWSQPDSWGNEATTAASDLNKVVTVPAATTVITGVWMRNRWGDPDTDTYYCTVEYDEAASMSVAVVNVPNASK